MGLRNKFLMYFDQHINNCNLMGTTMLELGDQVIDPDGPGTGKSYYTNLGFEHISVDVNGENGSLIKDLRNPEEFKEWHDYFNVITNSGTTEHVEPVEYQYECFSIIHDCLKVGGIQIHLVPGIESLQNNHFETHCATYYSIKFFTMLAKENSYDILDMHILDGALVAVCLQKTKNNKFMKNRKLFMENLHINLNNLATDIHNTSKMIK